MSPILCLVVGFVIYVLGVSGTYVAARLGNEASNYAIHERLARHDARLGILEDEMKSLTKYS